MDKRLRELERRAAAGDEDARVRLINYWGKAGLVPTEEHINLMRCGFATGFSSSDGEGAISAGLHIFCHLLRQLVLNSYEHQIEVTLENDPDEDLGAPEYVAHLRQEKSFALHQISLISKCSLPRQISTRWNISHIEPFINTYLDNSDQPPLYAHYNPVTQSMHLGFCNTGITDHERTDITIKLYLIIRRWQPIEDTYQVELSWNIGEIQAPPFERHDSIPAFANLPRILMEQPNVWSEWGWGDCNYRVRHFGNWDYDPIDDTLGSRHWLRDQLIE